MPQEIRIQCFRAEIYAMCRRRISFVGTGKDGHFFCNGFLREDLAQYRSGGYHPVHLGDTMQGGRYHIVQKFGWGRDATVWLAEDRR